MFFAPRGAEYGRIKDLPYRIQRDVVFGETVAIKHMKDKQKIDLILFRLAEDLALEQAMDFAERALKMAGVIRMRAWIRYLQQEEEERLIRILMLVYILKFFGLDHLLKDGLTAYENNELVKIAHACLIVDEIGEDFERLEKLIPKNLKEYFLHKETATQEQENNKSKPSNNH
jgi:hypothetical protein